MSKQINTEKIFYFQQQINQLLTERPELRPFQDKINQAMEQIKTPEARVSFLMELIGRRMHSMTKHIQDLMKL